jgi:hypothetical protein
MEKPHVAVRLSAKCIRFDPDNFLPKQKKTHGV